MRQTAQHSTKPSLVAGIDPGERTGVAVYDGRRRELVLCDSMAFWEAVLLFENELLPRGDGGHVGLVVVEDARRLPIYDRHRRRRLSREERDRLCRSVGRIDRDTDLWAQWLHERGYTVRLQAPVRAGKWDGQTLQRVTGYRGATNQHGRDAARLVWGCGVPAAHIEKSWV